MTVELLSADDGAALVTIGGELDMKTISELEAAVEPILSAIQLAWSSTSAG